MGNVMKYIITESQHNSLFTDKNYRLVANMWNEGMDIYEISELTGLRESVVLYLLRENVMNVDCGFIDTIMPILYRTSLVNTNFHNENMKLNLKWGWLDDAVDFEYEDSDYAIVGSATPYEYGNCHTPIGFTYFEDKKINEYYEEYYTIGDYLQGTPNSFNTIQGLIDYLNNDYPKQLIKSIQKLIPVYENKLINRN